MDEIQNLSLTLANSNRIAVIFLVSSFLTLLTALIIMVASGAIAAFPAILQVLWHQWHHTSVFIGWIISYMPLAGYCNYWVLPYSPNPLLKRGVI